MKFNNSRIGPKMAQTTRKSLDRKWVSIMMKYLSDENESAEDDLLFGRLSLTEAKAYLAAKKMKSAIERNRSDPFAKILKARKEIRRIKNK